MVGYRLNCGLEPHSYSAEDGVWCNSVSYAAKDDFGGNEGFIKCPDARTIDHCLLEGYNYCNRDPDCVAFQGLDIWSEGDLTWYQPCRELVRVTQAGATLWVKGELENGFVHFVYNNGPGDGQDNGYVLDRRLLFTKVYNSTPLHITYSDNLRIASSGTKQSCYWALRIDGAECPSGDMRADKYSALSSQNDHDAATVEGICEGVSSGSHILEVYVGNPAPGRGETGSNCYTGFNTQHWILHVEEVGLIGIDTSQGVTPELVALQDGLKELQEQFTAFQADMSWVNRNMEILIGALLSPGSPSTPPPSPPSPPVHLEDTPQPPPVPQPAMIVDSM